MGFNSTLVVLNDALHEIENDKEFGYKVARAIQMAGRGDPININSGNHGNAATVIETHHAENIKLIAVGGNYGQDLGYVGKCSATSTDMLRSLAESLGYTIHKKPGVCLDCYSQRHLDSGGVSKCKTCGGTGKIQK